MSPMKDSARGSAEPLSRVAAGVALLESGYSVEWTPFRQADNGVFTPSYPAYDDRLMAALSAALELVGQDRDYVSHVDSVSGAPVSEMTSEQLSTFFTWVVRSERFCDGAISDFVQDGRILLALRRVAELATGD